MTMVVREYNMFEDKVELEADKLETEDEDELDKR